MGTSTYIRVTSEASLWAAWRQTLGGAKGRSRQTVGCDGQSISSFLLHETRNLRELSRELRATPFDFDDLRPVFVQKPNSDKFRVICVPTVRDRVVQRAVLEQLSAGDPCGLANSVSYGFIRGRRVEDAVLRAKQLRKDNAWVYKTDITSFFDQLDRTLLIRAVERTVRPRSLHPILRRAAFCEIQTQDEPTRRKLASQGIKAGRGVRQGMPLSPFFANVMLRDFDAAVERAGLRMVRYADDLVMFADSEGECQRLHSFCKEQLAKLELAVPDFGPGSKSQIFGPDAPADFLGVTLARGGDGYVVRIADKQVARIRQELWHFASIEQLFDRGITISRLGAVLDGKIAGYCGAFAHCDNIGQFELAITRWRAAILQKLFHDGLGIDVAAMPTRHRAFLEIVPIVRAKNAWDCVTKT